jgi:hypothetical protein
MKTLNTIIHSIFSILGGNYIILSEKDGKINANGMMNENKMKKVVSAFNSKINSTPNTHSLRQLDPLTQLKT